jgi:integrase
VREVEQLLAATKGHRNEALDCSLLRLIFRHGLCVSEACGLRLSQVDMDGRALHMRRFKRACPRLTPCVPTSLAYALKIHAFECELHSERSLLTDSEDSVQTVAVTQAVLQAIDERRSVEEVDGDGVDDLVLHFETKETGILCGDTSASLTGRILGG